MINLMDPKYYFPVKGEYRHQYNMVNLAKSIDVKDENENKLKYIIEKECEKEPEIVRKIIIPN